MKWPRWSIIFLFLRRFLMVCGVALLLLSVLCWTPYPWRMYHWLSMPDARLEVEPEWIVVLGGGGIPSETGLMRTYYAARVAARYPAAQIMVALPEYEGAVDSSLRRMQRELTMRGVAADRIHLEPHGANTRAQAVEVVRRVDTEAAVLLVTSPSHMRRAVRTFAGAGFSRVGAHSAFDTHADGDMTISAAGVDDRLSAPAIEGSLTLRYRLWNNISYLTSVAREFTALGYYKWKGWI